MNKIDNLSEILPNRLYFGLARNDKQIRNSKNSIYFCANQHIIYPKIYSYFGPPHLGTIYNFSQMLTSLLMNVPPDKKIIQYTSKLDELQRSNDAFLMGAYCVLILRISPQVAMQRIMFPQIMGYKSFCDTTNDKTAPTLKLIYYLEALHKTSFILNYFSFDDFDHIEYERLYNGGNINWILPEKFLAFPSLYDDTKYLHKYYLEYFKKNNVKMVIRLNNSTYDARIFTQANIQHYNLYFPDCTVPSLNIVSKFLCIAENTDGAIAIHCKAGLGRTGTLIAAYLIKHYDITALEAVAWLRICRPGSVIGIQQQFLQEQEKNLKQEGIIYRHKYHNKPNHEFSQRLHSKKRAIKIE